MKVVSIGVELEGGINEKEFKQLLEQIQNDTDLIYSHFTYSYDPSVNVREKQIPDLELKYWDSDPEKVFKFIRIVFSYGFKQNETCGNHIHIRFDDTESAVAVFTYRKAWRLFKKHYEKQFKDKIKYLARMDNRYCLLTYNEDEYIERTVPRYRAINILSYYRHGTLEVRILPHADSAEELIDAIKWLLSTIEYIVNQRYHIKKEINISTSTYKLITEIEYNIETINTEG